MRRAFGRPPLQDAKDRGIPARCVAHRRLVQLVGNRWQPDESHRTVVDMISYRNGQNPSKKTTIFAATAAVHSVSGFLALYGYVMCSAVPIQHTRPSLVGVSQPGPDRLLLSKPVARSYRCFIKSAYSAAAGLFLLNSPQAVVMGATYLSCILDYAHSPQDSRPFEHVVRPRRLRMLSGLGGCMCFHGPTAAYESKYACRMACSALTRLSGGYSSII